MKHDPNFPSSEDQAHEWSVQERALAAQRAGIDAPAMDTSLRTYQLMAQVLAQPLDAQLPPDFARRVAQQVARPVDARLESNLLALLGAAMALAALAAALLYGAQWLPALDGGLVGALLRQPWPWALAACLGLTRLSQRWWLQHGPIV
jgi:O-antigen/teichoic acid export membrane protein